MRNLTLLFTMLGAGACYGPRVAGGTSDGGDDGCGALGEACCSAACDEGLACLAGRCSCFAALAMSELHACVVRGDGQLWCWGEGSAGKLGYAADVPCTGASGTLCSPTPAPAPTLRDPSSLGLGAGHTCVARDGELWCVGADDFPDPNPARIGVFAGVSAVGSGRRFSCFIDGGQVYCVGYNQSHVLGTTTLSPEEFSVTPLPIQGLDDAEELAVGSRSACARRQDGRVLCWGGDHYQQLGSAGAESCTDELLNPHPCSSIPLLVSLDDAAVHIVSGSHFACAELANGQIWCWGDNRSGQILGTTVSDTTPVRIDDELPYPARALFVGGLSACARLAPPSGSPELVCWGNNDTGLFGNASTAPIAPLQASGFPDALVAAPGVLAMCALYTDHLACAGDAQYGELGSGDFTSSDVPVANLAVCPGR